MTKKSIIRTVTFLSVLIIPLILTGKGISNRGEASKRIGADVSLCTTVGGVFDQSFNEGIWKEMKTVTDTTDITANYYTPKQENESTLISMLDIASMGNPNIIFATSFTYAKPVGEIQYKYPDIKYVCVDTTPQNADGIEDIADNTIGMTFAEEEAGFLAGYAAVMDGYRNLGFAGGLALPSVKRFGYGYVYGAEYAAKELGLKPGEINIKYTYLGSFSASPEAMSMAVSWYRSGTEVIFIAAGSAGSSVIKAAEQTAGKVIGVDSDMSAESETIITSALKNVGVVARQIIMNYEAGEFDGGKQYVFSAKDDAVGLPMETSRFKTFSREQYDDIYTKLKNDEIKMDTDIESADSMALDFVKVTLL